jgi:nitrogen fixation-related uncharacterized protein
MRIKLVVAILVVADVMLFVGTIYFLAKAASHTISRHEQVVYAVRYATSLVVLLVCLFATIVAAFVWAQKQREEYRDLARRNLEDLIEGTLKDHGKQS